MEKDSAAEPGSSAVSRLGFDLDEVDRRWQETVEYTSVHWNIEVYMYTSICMRMCMRIYKNVCVCVHLYIYT